MENLVIISAEKKDLSKSQNLDRTAEMREVLVKKGLQFHGVNLKCGTYAFMVVTKNNLFMLNLAEKFGQDSVTISNEKRETVRISKTGKETLGILKRSEKELAFSSNYCIIVKEEGYEYYYST